MQFENIYFLHISQRSISYVTTYDPFYCPKYFFKFWISSTCIIWYGLWVICQINFSYFLWKYNLMINVWYIFDSFSIKPYKIILLELKATLLLARESTFCLTSKFIDILILILDFPQFFLHILMCCIAVHRLWFLNYKMINCTAKKYCTNWC